MGPPQPTLDPNLSAIQPNHGLPLQDAMQPQQHALDPSLNDLIHQTTHPATPIYSAQDIQVPRREHSHSVTQTESPTTVQGDDLPQQIPSELDVYSNLQSGPGQLDHTDLQRHYVPYTPHHPPFDGNHGQETRNISTFLQSPNPDTRYEADSAHPMTMAQQSHHERSDYHYSESSDSYSIISPGVPSAELNALTSSHNCLCGPNCDCPFCAAHPYNDATRARVQDLNNIIAMDNHWACNHSSRPQSGYGDAPRNGTNIESGMGQGYPPLNEDSLPSATFGSTNTPIQDHALQPTFNEEGSVDNGNHSRGFSHPTMRNSGYFTIEYSEYSNGTEAVETCTCGNDGRCDRCIAHQGHNGLPNYDNA